MFEGVTGHLERNYIDPCFMDLRQIGAVWALDRIRAEVDVYWLVSESPLGDPLESIT